MHTPAERQIFRYCRGDRVIAADPLVLYRSFLKAIGGQQAINDIEKQIKSDSEELADQAGRKLLGAVQQAFGLQSLDDDGNGNTEDEQLRTYFDFLAFLAESKKKAETMPTCAEPTAALSSPAVRSAMQTGSASGSTEGEYSTNRQPL